MAEMTGEPEPLSEQIKERFKEGAEAAALLKRAEEVYAECLAMEISENKYTKHSVQQLSRSVNEYRKYVATFLAELEAEKKEKEAYAAKAAKLMAWLVSTTQDLEDRNFDNSLAGAQAKTRQFAEWTTAGKPPKVSERAALGLAHAKVVSMLEASKHNRPKFQPAPEHTLEALDAAFEKLGKAEKAREEALSVELKRQEKLSQLSKEFALKAEDMRAWCEAKEAYLRKEEDVSTVIATQIQLDLLGSYAVEYEQSKAKVDKLKELCRDLTEGNYRDAAAIQTSLEQTLAMWSALEPLQTAKHAVLKEAETKELEKEALRVEFSRMATEFERWTRATVDKIGEFAFGSTLEAVKAYQEVKEKDDAALLGEGQSKVKALEDLIAKMTACGITDNVHTLVGGKDVHSFFELLEQAIARRTQAYQHEVERQEAMEATRIAFAEAVARFVASIEAATKALEAVTGEPQDKARDIAATYAEGEAQKKLLAECEEIDSRVKELGIIDNKHTPFTVVTLRAKLQKFEAFVANLLASTEQEKVMKERKLEREREWAAKERAEGLLNQYQNSSQPLAQWLDNTSESLGFNPKVASVAELDELVAQLDAIVAEQPAKQALFTELGDLVKQLADAGSDAPAATASARHQKLTESWADCEKSIAARKEWLAKERVTQENNQKLRMEFAENANAFHAWIVQEKSVQTTGELEEQLEQSKTQEAAVGPKGEAMLAEIVALDKKLADAGAAIDINLTTHTATTLKGEFDQLRSMLTKRREMIIQQIDAKKFGGMQPEELAECRELFSQFDKDKTGLLKWYHFKGILQALGEEMSDEQIKKVVSDFDENGDESISFDEFITFMKQRRNDTDSKAEIIKSFRDIANGKDAVTLDELSAAMPRDQAEYLARVMPPAEGGALDFSKWADTAFM